jgi:hypothetical protein
MCLCTLSTDRFLRSVDHSDVFLAYCRDRQVSFMPTSAADPPTLAVERWIAALAQLPETLREQVEWEQDAVNELSTPEGTLHLPAAMIGGDWPQCEVPDGGPLALSFLLRRPALFHEVFFHHENREPDVWHTAKAAPGLPMPDPAGVASSLAETLDGVFAGRHDVTRHCTVEAHRLPGAVCLVARAPNPHWWAERVGAGGEPMVQRQSSVLSIHLAYYPADGTVLLHAPARAGDLIRDFLVSFGGEILGFPIDSTAGGFSLDRLKLPFHPLLPDGVIDLVRVKALRLCSSGHAGRRQLQLETLASDEPSAMDDLLRLHASEVMLTEFHVTYAELQVRLQVTGRGKNHLIRLWPDRCDVGRGPVGDLVLACLRRWGL